MSRVLKSSVKNTRDGDWSYRVRTEVEVRGHNWIIKSGPGLRSSLGTRLTGMVVCSRPGEARRMISTWTAVWVKICASWAGLLLYLWTLVAPLLLPNRDFS